jgi:SNF2 family DNA or RNA helicase
MRESESGEDDTGGKMTKDELVFSRKKSLRDHLHIVRSLGKEFCGRVRSLRYIQRVKSFQNLDENEFRCSDCHKEGLPVDSIGVLSSCGHSGCLQCLRRYAADNRCIESPSCSARVSHHEIVSAADLGLDREDGHAERYGCKLTSIVETVSKIVRKGDRVIVFCQFDDLKDKVANALEETGIKTVSVKGSVSTQTKAVSVFQNVQDVVRKKKAREAGTPPSVLMLKMDDQQSAGLNLTSLNHAVFVHPLLADSQADYEAYETQAIGRIRRYGQEKTVYVWRFFANDTIDTEIYEQHRSKKHGTDVPVS